jgi:hypothetical protein
VPTSPSNELEQFHRFVAAKLANGETQLSPEAALDQWRKLSPRVRGGVAAVREVLADMAAGDSGTPYEQFDGDFRVRHNIPRRP